MTAVYPTGIWAPTTKRGWYNILWAAHMNDLQTELEAAQKTFGLNPHRNFNLPGGLSRNYGTVEIRMTEHARGTDLPIYRGMATDIPIVANTWNTIAFEPMADPYHLAVPDGNSMTLNATGMWFISARAEYRATGYTLVGQAKRRIRVLINDVDVGLRDFTKETAKNSFALHNQVAWPEVYTQGTTVKVQIRTDVTAPDHPMLANINLRAYLIRCTDGVVAESAIRLPDIEEG
jgi:hypothetical protein